MVINFLIKAFMNLNVFIIRASRGHIGTLLARQTVLLLHTVGRKSGRQIVTPISYFSTDGYYFLVGSNWGRQKGWNMTACGIAPSNAIRAISVIKIA